jgi:AcrR family transcriptional regulator
MTQPASEPKRAPYDVDSLTDLALGVFRERGYDATSMEQLAAAAGISKAAFYHHVSGKEELLAAGMERALTALEALFDEPGSSSGQAIDQLAHLLRRIVELEHDLLSEVTVLLRARGNSAVERIALERRRAFDRRIGELIATAQRQGSINAELDPLLSGRLAIGMATWLVEWYRPDGPLDIVLVADHVVTLALRGLAIPSASI